MEDKILLALFAQEINGDMVWIAMERWLISYRKDCKYQIS